MSGARPARGIAEDGDQVAARELLKLVWLPGEVYEVRILKHNHWGHTAAGYFDDPDLLMDAVGRFSGVASVYRTLNPVDPALLARANNRIIDKADHATGDALVTRRREMLVDFDAVRPSGISSTNTELARARATCDLVRAHLSGLGWPEPVVIMSGNGWHLVYALDLPNDEASSAIVAAVLRRLNENFATPEVTIDTTVANASRISALPGTLKMKGDSTSERPHRMVRVDGIPESFEPVTPGQLAVFAGHDEPVAAPVRRAGAVRLMPQGRSVEKRLADAGIQYRQQPPDSQGITWFHVERCPFHDDGRPFECGVGQKQPDGVMTGKCFHPEGKSKGWADFRDALGLGHGGVRRSDSEPGGRPEIMTSGRHLRDIVDDTWGAIHGENDPVWMFCYGNRLAEVRSESGEGLIVKVFDEVAIRARVDRIADFVQFNKRGDAVVPARPPRDVLQTLMAYPEDVPRLVGIVGMPPVSAEGDVDTCEGYQPRTGLFYEANGQAVPPVPVQPEATDVARARMLIVDELLGEFPFGDNAGRANAIAALLTVVARQLYAGPSPLFAFDAPVAGTGKSLLAGVIGCVLTGQTAATLSAPGDDDEWRKRITAKLLNGAPITLIDNVKRRVDSASLCQALTSTVWSDRLLGTNELLRLPNFGLWMMTGNNLVLDGEVARRTVWVRLDSREDRPWERNGWRHELPGWALEQRPHLVWALLVLVRHWVASGKPAWTGKSMGSFEAHNSVVGGILENAGIEGFLENREALYAAADSEAEEWRSFLQAWWAVHRDNSVGAKDLVDLVADGDHLPSLIPVGREVTPKSLQTRLGRALKIRRDRRYGDLFVRSLGVDSHQGGNRYRLERAEPGGGMRRGSADAPHGDPPASDSIAEPEEPAELNSTPHARGIRSGDTPRDEVEAAEEVPHVQQVPQAYSVITDGTAEPGAELRGDSSRVPQDSVDADREAALWVAVMCPRCGERPTVAGSLCFRCSRT